MNGKPPYIEYPPLKCMMMITHKVPPILDKKSNADPLLKEVVNLCLNADPLKRPNADDLLKKKFLFKAMGTDYIRDTLVNTLSNNYSKEAHENEEQKEDRQLKIPV